MAFPAPDDPAFRKLNRFLRVERRRARVDPAALHGLVLAYLAGEPHAVWVLGDFTQYTDLPAVKPAGLDQRVRYVLGLLPPVLAQNLGCDLVEHGLEQLPQANEAILRRAIAVKRAWMRGEYTDDQLVAHRRSVRPHPAISRATFDITGASPSHHVPQGAAVTVAKAMGHVGSSAFVRETEWQVAHIRSRLGG